jgi:hypothetical protein
MKIIKEMLDIQTFFFFFFFSEFGSNLKCHNLMRSIILRNVTQFYRIVTHIRFEPNFRKKYWNVKYFSNYNSHIPLILLDNI